MVQFPWSEQKSTSITEQGENEDENQGRGNWSSKLDFLLSCLGYAVGLGNVWRFPYLCYRNGGGLFFIPYSIALAFIGIPILMLELTLGQYSSSGPLTCWKFSPIFTGIGYAMNCVSSFVGIYYNIIMAWALFYLFDSFRSDLPWHSCGDWSTNLCYYNVKILNTNGSNCTEACKKNQFNNQSQIQWTANETQGICYLESLKNKKEGVRAFCNETEAKKYFPRVLASQEYFDRYVTGSAYSQGFFDLGEVHWQLVLCYLLAFVFVVLALSKSIKTSGKVVYFTATFPYLVLVILLIRGLMLEGSDKGIHFYLTPEISKLSEAQVWKDAAVQIFFSLSAAQGGLVALASYNKFHNDVIRDTLIVAFGNCLTSFFAGFVIFSYLGHLSDFLGVPVKEVAKSGPSLTFVIYPFAVTQLPVAPFWSILFFLMLITLGVDSEFVLVETVVTSLMDKFPKLREQKLLTVIGVCVVMFLLGLTMTTNGGIYMLEIMDTYAGGWSVLFIAIFECISIAWIYGVFRFLDDLQLMVGERFCSCIPFVALKFWWVVCWCCATPVLCAIIMIFSWVDYTGLANSAHYNVYADLIGWGMTLAIILSIISTAIYVVAREYGSIEERLRVAFSPSVEWGPALVKYRHEAENHTKKYSETFVIDVVHHTESRASKGSEIMEMSTVGGIENKCYTMHDEGHDNRIKTKNDLKKTELIPVPQTC
ncbi:sodium-dependent proline transporter-like [Saccostrea echinata]|uniref:sodium-dependent proline transporter-like n=1 Tax=Saccostrea echinata TaxID=191078 RepID=UPI002A81FC5D|nr:sodium-dependent proline transporter-like [Saccostrea echinata]